MKKYLSHPFVLFSFFVFGMAIMAICLTTFSFANEGDLDQGMEEMEGMEDPVVLSPPDEESNLPEGVIPSCLDDYATWPHSRIFNEEALWSPEFFPTEVWVDRHGDPSRPDPYFNNPDPRREWMMDLNGDGLLDYIYVYHASANSRRNMRECVYLNTGKGWEPVYRCHGTVAHHPIEGRYVGDYYGDCALIDEDE